MFALGSKTRLLARAGVLLTCNFLLTGYNESLPSARTMAEDRIKGD
jgi:hypothetical protein